jgi:hypothetical protein
MLPLIMGVLGPILGKVVDTVGSKLGVDMSTDEIKSKKLEIELEVSKLVAQSDLKQLEINLAEATNPNRQWPTWRESLGYICAAAVAYHFVIQQMLAFILSVGGVSVILPVLDMTGILTILSAMLGVHFVDSRYNSPMGQMPTVKPKEAKGNLVYDADAGGTVWRAE